MTISAIIPTFNSPVLLRRAIQSALSQTIAADEVIVIDDGSGPETRAAVEEFGSAVRYVWQENAGTSAARNAAAKLARFEWLSFLDHDDEWMPRRLECHQAAVQREPDAVLVYSSYLAKGIDGQCRMIHPPPPNRLFPLLRLRNVCPAPVFSIRRDKFFDMGGFSPSLRGSCEDWDLFFRIARSSPVAFVSEPLLKNQENIQSQSRNYPVMLRQTLSIVDTTLVADLTGIRHYLWRHRSVGYQYYKAAIGARTFGHSATRFLLNSFLWWPFPEPESRRFWTTLAECRDRILMAVIP